MNRIFLILLILGIAGPSMAQQSKVVSAYNYLNYYLQDKDVEQLKKAKENIDQAIENDKTMGKPKTWYYRGNVYWAMQDSKNEEFTSGGQNPLLTAIESYKKVYELEPSYEYADESYQKALIGYKNLGIMAFNENNFNNALKYFEGAYDLGLKKNVLDTAALENSSIAAIRANDYDKAEKYLKQLISYKIDEDGNRYIQLITMQKAKGDTAVAMKTLAEARAEFPNDQKLLTEELNYYLMQGKSAEAEKLLVLAIEKDPGNHLLHYAAGTIYEDLGKREPAIAAYKKAIELKPEFWEAYFNLGALYNNEAKRLQDIANNEKDMKKYEAGNKLAEAEFDKALPNLEKALELAPAESSDVQALLRTLKQIYSRLNMKDKYEKVSKMMEP
ncbi:MAG: tetratricopeptide repeat protein [Bacteroidia bacterium]